MQQMQLSLGRKAIFPKNVSKLQNPQVGHAPRHIENLNGHTFGRLTVIGLCGIIASGNTKHPTWLCLCECGNFKTVFAQTLLTLRAKSCGCFHKQMMSTNFKTHGMHNSPEYRSYYHAKQRCNNPKEAGYERYGGRGIEFRFESFEEFYADVGNKPTLKHSLDRIDVNGHYELGNIKWSTVSEQNNNTRRTVYLTIDGETKASGEWARIVGKTPNQITCRLNNPNKQWCDRCVVFNPPYKYCTHVSQ